MYTFIFLRKKEEKIKYGYITLLFFDCIKMWYYLSLILDYSLSYSDQAASRWKLFYRFELRFRLTKIILLNFKFNSTGNSATLEEKYRSRTRILDLWKNGFKCVGKIESKKQNLLQKVPFFWFIEIFFFLLRKIPFPTPTKNKPILTFIYFGRRAKIIKLDLSLLTWKICVSKDFFLLVLYKKLAFGLEFYKAALRKKIGKTSCWAKKSNLAIYFMENHLTILKVNFQP